MSNIIGITGHRPEKILIGSVNGQNAYVRSRLRALAKKYLSHYAPEHVHVGGARGWDTAAIEACLELGIPYTLHLPDRLDDFMKYWEEAEREELYSFIAGAHKVIGVSRETIRNELLARNISILEASNFLLALWNNEEAGGTFYTVKRAHDKGMTVTNLWSVWEKRKDARFPFSNFQKSIIVRDGISYQSMECFYQAMKTEDLAIRQKIANMEPKEAKTFGKNMNIREDWEDVKDKVMRWGLKRKFSISYYRNLLCQTGSDELVEWNYWHDNYWGHCYCSKCIGKGQNNLGKMVMEIRTEICD